MIYLSYFNIAANVCSAQIFFIFLRNNNCANHYLVPFPCGPRQKYYIMQKVWLFNMNFTYYKVYSCWRWGGGGGQTTGPAFFVYDEKDGGFFYDNDNDDDKQMIYRQNPKCSLTVCSPHMAIFSLGYKSTKWLWETKWFVLLYQSVKNCKYMGLIYVTYSAL